MEDGPTNRPKSKSEIKPGRPRIDESIADTVIRIRKETGWGYTKIVQAMRRLGHRISRQTVKNILVEAGLGPDPSDHPDTWSDFLKRHAATMWQCDFASKRKWTVSEKHLDHILHVSQDWYNRRSGRSARGNLPPVRANEPMPTVNLSKQRIVCHGELGDHLKSYRAAA